MNIPEDLKYSKEHEWVLIEEGIATSGITDFAQSELGDIVFVEVPAVGRRLRVEETAGNIEAVKTVADLFSPLSGEVLDVNEDLAENPERVNHDPYGEGWIFKLTLDDPTELDRLLDSMEYEKHVEAGSA